MLINLSTDISELSKFQVRKWRHSVSGSQPAPSPLIYIYNLECKARPIHSHIKGSTTSCKLPSQTNTNMEACRHLLIETFSVGWWLSWNALTLNLVKHLKSILLRLSDPERLSALSREKTGFQKVLFQLGVRKILLTVIVKIDYRWEEKEILK